ncbi:MAG: sulfite exporter TauE/SafE family protein [Chloroflexota bacterium]
MNAIVLAFLTGLTTGGLSCLAVQGGLLAGSLANQVERDVRQAAAKAQKGKGSRRAMAPSSPTAFSILLFLAAKLVSYTLLGLLLGWLGSLIQLNAMLRALLMLAIGVFMIGNALRMLDVHPVFRNFVIEPPAGFRRFLRRTAKDGTELATPVLLGVLTVLIPCGVTQAMMAAAMATGSALEGASLMFAFTLGTSPVFFFVAYLATQIGARLEKWFMRFVAAVVLVLGLVSTNAGLTLMGSPLALSNWLPGSRMAETPGPRVPVADASTTLTVNVANDGYFPYTSYAQAGVAVTLNLVTENTMSCSRAFVIPVLGVEELLPRTGMVSLAIPPQEPGTVLRYSCSMGMYHGEIVFAVEN